MKQREGKGETPRTSIRLLESFISIRVRSLGLPSGNSLERWSKERGRAFVKHMEEVTLKKWGYGNENKGLTLYYCNSFSCSSCILFWKQGGCWRGGIGNEQAELKGNNLWPKQGQGDFSKENS
jgi:hypothetical protein